jgi:hypothetical protein
MINYKTIIHIDNLLSECNIISKPSVVITENSYSMRGTLLIEFPNDNITTAFINFINDFDNDNEYPILELFTYNTETGQIILKFDGAIDCAVLQANEQEINEGMAKKVLFGVKDFSDTYLGED